MFVDGHPTHILKQVWPPSLVDEKKESPEAMIRDLHKNSGHNATTFGMREGGKRGREGYSHD